MFSIIVVVCLASMEFADEEKIRCNTHGFPAQAENIMECVQYIPAAHRKLLDAYGDRWFIKDTACHQVGQQI